MSTALWRVGRCPQCERPNQTVGPFHGERGGPMFCLQCGMAWHGKHGRKRKFGRVVIKAMRAFSDAGGRWDEIDKLKLRALAPDLGGLSELLGLLGGPDTIGRDIGDITSELLRDTLRLTHPDHHPTERYELATRVTRELRALEPYVFPAPKPRPVPTVKPASSRGPERPPAKPTTTADKPAYPCETCEDVRPHYYCTACRAEDERRCETERELERQKQRAWYRTRQERKRARRRLRGNLPQWRRLRCDV